jgi:glycosyltransferase involved in cell wall biosynthesis
MQDYLTSQLPLGVRKTVHFRGHVGSAELRSALRLASVAVFPSYAEAFAMGPMEAMAEGCPTIYSQRGSGPELIRHGIDGLLADPDSPQQIAESILKLVHDENLAGELGRRGRETIVSNYSLEVMLRRNVDFYFQCVKSFHDQRAHKRFAQAATQQRFS